MKVLRRRWCVQSGGADKTRARLEQVILTTTMGDIDVELWPKEAPLACRNFIQLCLEGYYDNTMFHRIIAKFMVQGGDPSGTGQGGESVWGETFKDEIHSRLRFGVRGLLAMAKEDVAVQRMANVAGVAHLDDPPDVQRAPRAERPPGREQRRADWQLRPRGGRRCWQWRLHC